MCTAFSAPSDSSQPNFTNSAAFSATMPKTVSAGDGRFRPRGLLRTLIAPRRWPGTWAAGDLGSRASARDAAPSAEARRGEGRQWSPGLARPRE